MKLYPNDILQSLEFDKILHEISKRCESESGKERVTKVRPMDNYDEIQKLLLQTKEMLNILLYEDKFPSEKIFDIREITKLLGVENYVLNEEQLHALRKTALLSAALIKFFDTRKDAYPALLSFTQNIIYEKNIQLLISKILDDDGKLKNDASAELIKIHRQSEKKSRELDKTFQSVLNKFRKNNVLGDVEESMRNGRRVMGLQSEFKRQVKGIIHDESDTGKTTFIEPEEIVLIQNELFELEREEKREVYRILKSTTLEVSRYQNNLESYAWLLSIIDLNRAKAKYAIDIQADMPVLEKIPLICLYHAVHPVLYQYNKKINKIVVPLDVELQNENRILVISGPNAGGKSVAMKTIGLLQIMLQSGLLIPTANQSRVGIFKNIFCDIGDAQNLEDELSTYSSRLLKMKYFLQQADKNTLILIDEFGTGTDPVSGGAIAEAVLNDLNALKVFGVITTHYSNLKAFASNHEGIINGSMLYNEQELKPVFQLEAGKPGSSYAFEIAHKNNLPQKTIEFAKTLVDKEHIRFEELLKSVRIEKEHIKLRERELKRKEEEIAKKESDMQATHEKVKEKEKQFNFKKLEKEDDTIRFMQQQFKNLSDEFKNAQSAEKNVAKEKLKNFIVHHQARNNKEKKDILLHTHAQVQKTDLIPGTAVRMLNGTETGILESVKNNIAVVQFKNMKTKLPADELIVANENDISATTKSQVQVIIDNNPVHAEIDLRGKPKEEAMLELEQFLDRSVMRNIYRVRIIHGKGTGVLRDAVKHVLKNYTGIKSYKFEEQKSGGDGVTVAEF